MNLALPIPRINVRHVALAVVLALFASFATAMPVDQIVPEPVVTAIDAITPDFLDELVGTSQAEAWGWAKSAWNGVKRTAGAVWNGAKTGATAFGVTGWAVTTFSCGVGSLVYRHYGCGAAVAASTPAIITSSVAAGVGGFVYGFATGW